MSYYKNVESDEEEEDNENKQYLEKVSALLIAVDVTLNENFHMVVEVLIHILNEVLLTSTKNIISLCFYGAENDDENFPNLNDSKTTLLKKLYAIRQSDLPQVETKVPFSTFLQKCKEYFVHVNKNYHKRMYFVSDNSNPIVNDDTFLKLSTEFMDLKASDIYFDVLPIDENFDFSIFFNKIYEINSYAKREEEHYYDKEALLERLMQGIFYGTYYSHMKLYLGENVDSYINCLRRFYGSAANLLKKKMVTCDTFQEVSAKTRENVKQHFFELRRKHKHMITAEEKEYFQYSNHPIGIVLKWISDKRQSTIGCYHQRPSTLKGVDGDKFFYCLWQSVYKKKKFLQCSLRFKKGGTISNIELIPIVMNNRPNFIFVILPNVTNLVFSQIETNRETVIQTKFEDLLVSITQKMSLTPQDIKQMKPLRYCREENYLKKMLLGSCYEETVDVLKHVKPYKQEYEQDLTLLFERIGAMLPLKKRTASSRGNVAKRIRKV